MYPKNLKYSQSHEWVKVDKDIATIGITDFATKQLTDLVYVELPSLEGKVSKGSFFGAVESVKAVSDLCSPVSGKIIKINDKMIKVKIDNLSELDTLMDSEEYEQFVNKEREE